MGGGSSFCGYHGNKPEGVPSALAVQLVDKLVGDKPEKDPTPTNASPLRQPLFLDNIFCNYGRCQNLLRTTKAFTET